MSAAIPAGMDHRHYGFSPLPERPALAWPQGKRVAFWILLSIEHWEFRAPDDAHREPRFVGDYGSFDPDYGTWGQREYGNRVGVFRILDLLDRYGLKASVALNASAAERYAPVVDACRSRGFEFLGHGSHATRMITGRMSEAEERDVIARSLDTLERVTGTRPAGWHAQDYGESERTPRLLAEAGLDYVVDWPNDDQPYAMSWGKPLVSLPAQPEWDDVQLLWLKRFRMTDYPTVVADALDTLTREGGRVFCLSLHPWMIGMAHRVRYLETVLERVAASDRLWHARAGEIVSWYRRTMLPAAAGRPG